MLNQSQFENLQSKLKKTLNVKVYLLLDTKYQDKEVYSSGKMPEKWFAPFIKEWEIKCFIKDIKNDELLTHECSVIISFKLSDLVWEDNEGFSLDLYLSKDGEWLTRDEANKLWRAS